MCRYRKYKREIDMVDFSNEIPKGYPKLDNDYWTKLNKTNEDDGQVDVNTNFALKDLKDISVFYGKK